MKKLTLLLALLGGVAATSAQQRYWVFLTDKGQEAAFYLAHPETFLGPVSLERRARMGIAVNYSDVPPSPAYVQTVGKGVNKVLMASRCLNAVAVEATDAQIYALSALPFVKGARPVGRLIAARAAQTEFTPPARMLRTPADEDVFSYGEAAVQNYMLNIQALHNRGITGKGVRVGVFDAGFLNTHKIPAFDSIRANKQILITRDFVDGDENVYDTDSHGTNVLSTIAANIPGEMVGMAPHATFILARTEKSSSETQQEEHNWVAAIEWADSIGVDIVHSSLGYYHFDDNIGDYTYDDMDGNTSIITRGADWAAGRGILITSSAGNEGDGEWQYITAPCDGDSVLCVGAVDGDGVYAYFSSIGPSSDGQVKPDVVAMGENTTVANPYNNISTSNGTSFSGPIIAGFATCLIQAHPKRSNMEIIKAIQLSGDQYNFPDDFYGYGIPNAAIADSLLANVTDLETVEMPGDEKPSRTKEREAKEEIVFADEPLSGYAFEGGFLKISSESEITFVQLMRGGQKVIFLDAKAMKMTPNEVLIDAKYLLDGDYYYYIETLDYEENVKFSK